MSKIFDFWRKIDFLVGSYLFIKSTDPCPTTSKRIRKASRLNPSFSDCSQTSKVVGAEWIKFWENDFQKAVKNRTPEKKQHWLDHALNGHDCQLNTSCLKLKKKRKNPSACAEVRSTHQFLTSLGRLPRWHQINAKVVDHVCPNDHFLDSLRPAGIVLDDSGYSNGLVGVFFIGGLFFFPAPYSRFIHLGWIRRVEICFAYIAWN
jgi:hypothetical protein